MRLQEKSKACRICHIPSNVDEFWRFLELVTDYSWFVLNFSTISHPLQYFLRNGQTWSWIMSCEAAFSIDKNRTVQRQCSYSFWSKPSSNFDHRRRSYRNCNCTKWFCGIDRKVNCIYITLNRRIWKNNYC